MEKGLVYSNLIPPELYCVQNVSSAMKKSLIHILVLLLCLAFHFTFLFTSTGTITSLMSSNQRMVGLKSAFLFLKCFDQVFHIADVCMHCDKSFLGHMHKLTAGSLHSPIGVVTGFYHQCFAAHRILPALWCQCMCVFGRQSITPPISFESLKRVNSPHIVW